MSVDDAMRRPRHRGRLTRRRRAPTGPLLGVRRTVSAYVALTKPRVIELLLVTTRAGDDPGRRAASRTSWLVLATCVGGAAAPARPTRSTCYLDRDIDALMNRTKRRPLVTGEVSPRGGLVFGLALGVVSTRLARGSWSTGCRPWLPLAAILFYVVVYTMILKRRTAQNIVWGGVGRLHAGAHRLVGRHRSLSWTAGRCCSASSSSGRRRTTGRCR